MILTERHVISIYHPLWKKCDELSFLSKNLYNSALYFIKKHYNETSKFIRYNELYKEFSSSNQKDFRSLPSATSQQILMVFDKNLKSFFALLRKWKKNKNSNQ